MSTETLSTIAEFQATIDKTGETVAALGLTSCEGLAIAFPAIVNNSEVMDALASMVEPFFPTLAPLVMTGVISQEDAESLIHDMFHLTQIAAALGHMVGVDEAIGTVLAPVDLSDLAWADLPDFSGDEATDTDTEDE